MAGGNRGPICWAEVAVVIAHISDRYRSEVTAVSQHANSRTPAQVRWGRFPPRINGNTREGRQIKRLVALYTKLFDGELTELVRRDILELAETETLLDLLRASALTGGRIDLTALNRLINTKQRLRASLGLGGPMPDASVPTIEEMLAQADEADA